MQENAEMRDPSTTHGIAIMHFCMTQRQSVNDELASAILSGIICINIKNNG
jgi:hypothetical protein